MRGLLASAALTAMTLTGCASNNPKFACGLPESGIGCQPVSTVYDRAVAGTLPATTAAPTEEKRTESGPPEMAEPAEPGAAPDTQVATVAPGDPILTRPRIQRVWIRRWEDADGDLHDETWIYLRLDKGEWRIAP